MKSGKCQMECSFDFFKWESEEDNDALFTWASKRERYDGEVLLRRKHTQWNRQDYDILKLDGESYNLVGYPVYFIYQPSTYDTFMMCKQDEFEFAFKEIT